MHISKVITNWYQLNARKLPWRETKDPYKIWVSEIILQQTRVAQGLSYYIRFIDAFPDILSLSKAPEDLVLKRWEGLGYYSRARNMMFAANQIVDLHQGVFPNQYHEIIKLKGIGPYTAAAISSFAFGQAYAVVDGNVSRVLSRYYGIDTAINSLQGKKLFSELAQEIINLKDPATHNQAMMEFGALQCKPANPSCNSCPLASSCIAFSTNKVKEFPVKEKKHQAINKYLHFFLISNHQQILIEKRNYSGIWKGLYQLPLLETEQNKQVEDVLLLPALTQMLGNHQYKLENIQEITHKLTHRNLYIRFYHFIVSEFADHSYIKINQEKTDAFAFPRPIEKYLKEFMETSFNSNS